MGQCPICLQDYKTKASISGCEHSFCFQCIVTWSKLSSACPLCKQEFHEILSRVCGDRFRIYKVGNKKREWGVYEIEYLSKRIKFYQQMKFSAPLKPSASSKVHNLDGAYLARNPGKLEVLMEFVKIDLSAILYYTEQSIPFMTLYVQSLLLSGIDNADCSELDDCLGHHSLLFLHEIKQFAYSTLSLDSYIRYCDTD